MASFFSGCSDPVSVFKDSSHPVTKTKSTCFQRVYIQSRTQGALPISKTSITGGFSQFPMLTILFNNTVRNFVHWQVGKGQSKKKHLYRTDNQCSGRTPFRVGVKITIRIWQNFGVCHKLLKVYRRLQTTKQHFLIKDLSLRGVLHNLNLKD